MSRLWAGAGAFAGMMAGGWIGHAAVVGPGGFPKTRRQVRDYGNAGAAGTLLGGVIGAALGAGAGAEPKTVGTGVAGTLSHPEFP